MKPVCWTFGCLLFAASLAAQNDRATMVGSVTDQSGAAIQGATVTIRKTATNETFTATTNTSGDYRVFPLPLGAFEVRASFTGFRSKLQTGITLEVGSTGRVDFTLEVGETSQTTEVTSAASLLNTESAGMGQVIDHQKLVGLPVNNRDFATLAALSPGVVSPRGTIYGNGVASGTATGILVRGMSRADNVYHLDGTMISEGNGATTFRPNLDALQEFEVKTGLYGAEWGVRPGGQIIVVTKSGTNELHGNAFWFSRNDALDARNFFARSKTAFRRQQLGGTLGGPITIPKVTKGKDRAWFFFAFQDELIRSFLPLTGIVPAAQQRAGQFTTAIRDPLTGQPFAGNLIPAARINPIAQRLLKFWPEPNTPGALNFTSPNSSANSDNPQFIARVDLRVSDNNRWSGRFAQNSAITLLTDAIQEFSYEQPLDTWAQEITNTRTFKAAFVNTASFHFFRRPYFLGVKNPHVAEAQALGIPALGLSRVNPSGGLPRVSVTGFLGIGDSGSPPGGAVHIGNWQAKDDFSFQREGHFLKTGLEYRRHYNFYNIGASPGIDFQPRYSGNAFADFLLGTPAATRTGGESNRGRFAQNAYYLYLQDDWKVHRKLTLNLGLRGELRGAWKDRSGFMSNYQPYAGAFVAPVQNLTLQPWQTGRFQPGVPLIEWRRPGFLPRVGLAFRANDKTVIRAGYGIFANEVDVAILQDLGNQPRANAQVASFLANAQTPNISLSDPFPAALATTAIARYNGVETPLKLTATHSWGMSIQREIRRDFSIDLGYQGSHTSNRLETVSVNDAVPGTGPRQARRPFPQLQDVWVTMPSVDATYNGLEIKAQKRPGSDGIYLLGAFTWSKGLDNAAINSAVLGVQRQRSINMPLNLNKATSDVFIPRRLVLTAGYELPFGKGKPFLTDSMAGKVLGGWQFQGIAVVQDGSFITALLPGDAIDTGSALSQWPDLSRSPNLPPSERTPTRWFDTAAFARPVGLRYGNAGRAPIESPGIINLDISIQRVFRISERQKFELRLDAFNLANHANFSIPGQSFGTGAFGVIGAALDPRQLQAGIKYSF